MVMDSCFYANIVPGIFCRMFPHTWDIPAQLSAMCALELMFKSRSVLISGQEERYPLAEAHQPQQLSSLCAKASEAMFM